LQHALHSARAAGGRRGDGRDRPQELGLAHASAGAAAVRFNMGCGHNRLEGHVNVDAFAACSPDEVVDLERTPWPWPAGCAEEVVFNHSLEHMGADPKVFLALIAELYRICAPDAVVRITVPHPRHDTFIGDPTHVRIITPAVMSLFDRALNDEWQA